MEKLFTRPDTWNGGSVETLMYFGPATHEVALAVAKSLWSLPRLLGPYSARDLEPDAQPIVDHPHFDEDYCEQLVGVYTHHDGTQSPFVHTTIIDEDGLWVYAGPTVGGLPAEWGVGAYPFGDDRKLTWLEPLYDDLRLIVQHVAGSANILAAVYGWHTLVDLDTLLGAVAGTIPEERWGPIEVWSEGKRCFYPATHLDAPMRIDA